MSPLRALSSFWSALWGPPPIKDVWETESETFLRTEKEITCDWFGYTYWKVYALKQVSLTTGKRRVIEDWRLDSLSP